MIEENEIAACVRRSLNRYFKDLDGEAPSEIYNMVVSAVENHLLTYILDRAEANQTQIQSDWCAPWNICLWT